MTRYNREKLEECFHYFQTYVETYSGCYFRGFDDNYFLRREEGYKDDVYADAHNALKLDSWKREHIGTGYIADCFRDAFAKKQNLVYFLSDGKTEAQIEENIAGAERLFYNLYRTENDASSFKEAVNIFGGRYDLIAYMFFIKDKHKYLPISPGHFENAFSELGIDVKLQHSCSWENYSEYLSIIVEIREAFQTHFGFEITFLDAHSFVWMIPEAKKHFITKEMWLDILRNDTLLKLYDIDLISDFYSATNHTAICSEMSKKTGKPMATYNLHLGHAGKQITKFLHFESNIREDGSNDRGWSVLFRGDSRDDGLFEWQVKPELVEALESAFPELRLNAIAIEAIARNESALSDEFEADFEAQLEMSAPHAVLHSDFKDFVGVPRERAEQIETKHGKRYKRDRQRAVNAMHRANYLCECDPAHKTFLRKHADVNYTESHHLVPMAFQNLFDSTLDTESNIVSLCSNCHNQIHYGQGAEEILEKLYQQRENALKKEGIHITLEKLLSMYK